jgi:hypothetical protein
MADQALVLSVLNRHTIEIGNSKQGMMIYNIEDDIGEQELRRIAEILMYLATEDIDQIIKVRQIIKKSELCDVVKHLIADRFIRLNQIKSNI